MPKKDKYSKSQHVLKELKQIKRENEELAEELEMQKALEPVDPFPESKMTDEATEKRIEKASEDFWYFDKKYFPKSMYQDYADPGWFHKELIEITKNRDKKAHIIMGSRDTAKTATYKKWLVWAMLFGKRQYIGVGSSTLSPATNTVRDIRNYLMSNPRILNDFDLRWGETSEERLYFKHEHNPRGCFMDALSEERSTRGKQRNFFLRYDLIYVTDLENRESSLTEEAVEQRIQRLNEMRTSLSKNGTLIWEGNNFAKKTAMNHLKKEHEKGVISDNFVVHIYPAWDPDRKPKNIWHSRFPADSEAELRALMKPKDDADWAGDFQQDPVASSGKIFLRENYQEWEKLPDDLKCVIWTDPNLSKKGKGDQTAITCYGFSAMKQQYYIPDAYMKSYSDSNNLLDDLLQMRLEQSRHLITLGFDGNVKEESTWTNNVRNYSRLRNIPVPNIEYRGYTVDNLIKNVQKEWNKGNILLPPGFAKSEMGKDYINQVIGFRGKKANNPDDAPDSLICAHELLTEMGIGSMLNNDFEVYSGGKRKLNERF